MSIAMPKGDFDTDPQTTYLFLDQIGSTLSEHWTINEVQLVSHDQTFDIRVFYVAVNGQDLHVEFIGHEYGETAEDVAAQMVQQLYGASARFAGHPGRRSGFPRHVSQDPTDLANAGVGGLSI